MVTAMIWNIEVFGNYPNFREDMAVLEFTAQLMVRHQVDILVVQGMRQAGRNLLPSFVQALAQATGNRWSFDWLPGAIVTDAAPGAVTADDLGFVQRANNEGYCVVWRNNTLSPVQNALSANGHMSLAVNAVARQESDRQTPEIVAANPRAPHPAEFPAPSPPQAGQARGAHPSYSLRWKNVRRPAYVLAATPTPTYIVAYHAPVSGYGPVYGALASGLIDLVQDVQTYPAVVVGGDFNIIDAFDLEEGFKTLLEVDPWQAPPGANMVAGSLNAHGDYTRSMVRFSVNGQGRALLNPNQPRLCYGNPRDEVFYRLPAGSYQASGVIDVLADLMTPGGLTAQIQGIRPIQAAVNNAIANGRLPGIVQANAALMLSLQQVFAAQNPAPFASKLAAAVFYKVFISDHLPVFIQFN